MQFLNEAYTWDQANIITEGGGLDGDKPRDLFMKGIFIQGGVKNHNQRIYPVNEIGLAVESINEALRRGESVLGEADHPQGLNINLDRVSHMITEMWMDGPNGYGKLKLLPTPLGNLCRTLLEAKVKLGVSSRGSGNVDEYTGNVSDFEIITVDIVARPSAPNAYPSAVYEMFNTRRGGHTYDLATIANQDPSARKHLKKLTLDWLRSLKG